MSLYARIVLAGLLCLAAAAGWWKLATHYERKGADAVRAEWNRQVAQADQASARETLRRIERQQESQRAFDSEIAAARAAAGRADTAAGRLRDQLAAYVAAGQQARSNPPAAGDSAPAGDGGAALDLLAGMFSGADAVAGELAEAVDRSRAAGALCEKLYDSLMNKRGAE